MLELTLTTTENAIRRAYEEHPHVSRITDSEIAVTCHNDAHPVGHVCRLSRRYDGVLEGECYLRDTGEACPAAIGKKVCYHLVAAQWLFEVLETRAHDRACGPALHAERQRATRRARRALIEHMLDTAARRPFIPTP